jgi:hypothetical protein
MDVSTVLAKEMERLEERLAGKEVKALRLKGALAAENNRHKGEVAAVTAMLEEHEAHQQECRLQIQEHHGAVVAKMEATAVTTAEEPAASVANMSEEHGAVMLDRKEKHKAGLLEMRASLTASATKLTSMEARHTTTIVQMTEEHRAGTATTKAKHATSLADTEAPMTLSAQMHRVTEDELREALAFSRDEHAGMAKEHAFQTTEQCRDVGAMQGRITGAGECRTRAVVRA